MLNNILLAFWLVLPAAAANTIPVIVSKLPYLRDLNSPLDLGLKFNGKRVFGSHKSWRGLFFGILAGVLVTIIQKHLFINFDLIEELIDFDYLSISPILFGFFASFGALAGDAIESFFKRQFDVTAGKAWIPFDQIDSIVGVIVFTLPIYQFSLTIYVLMFIIWTIGHPISTVTGYLIKLKDEPI